MPKKLTLEEVNQRLKEAKVEYECTFYDGTHSPKSVFTHIKSGIEGESRYGHILSGTHPSWSPAYEKRKKERYIERTLTLEEVNERLKAANSEYECLKYDGNKSPNSLFVHILTNTGPKKGRYTDILRGKHPSWSPAYEKRKKERYIERTLTLEEVNERLREANSEYRCEKFDGTLSPKSVFTHIESGKSGESRYQHILSGTHPSWSPAYEKRKKEIFIEQTLTLEEVNEKLRQINSEYECLKYDGARSPKSVFIHIESGIEGESSYGSILRGSHPSWSPALNCNRPSNDKLCIVYFCKTKTYGLYDKYKNGPYLTIGVTTKDTKTRYCQNGLIKTFFQTETYDCLVHEKALLSQIVETIGQPEAGWEAWQWSQNREDIIKKIVDNYLFICPHLRPA